MAADIYQASTCTIIETGTRPFEGESAYDKASVADNPNEYEL